MSDHLPPLRARPFRCLLGAALALPVLVLSGCSSLLTLTDAPDPAVYRGTTLNARILHDSVDCQPRNGDDYACAYSDILWPLSLLDFIPSLALDTALLPVTGLQALLHKDEKEPTLEELIEEMRQHPSITPAPSQTDP